jgi:uncharacterized membrane protein YvbJ
MPACSSCGHENADDARFCSACGTPLIGEARSRERIAALGIEVG